MLNPDSSIKQLNWKVRFITPKNFFPHVVVQYQHAFQHCDRHFAFWRVVFSLWSGSRPWNPRHFNSQRKVLLLAQTPDELWNFWAISTNEDLRLFFSILFRVRWLRSLIVYGLPLHFSAISISWLFHFIVTSSSCDFGFCRMCKISRTDSPKKWHPSTIPL